MSNKILLKRNANANAAPTAAQLDSGELAINTADGKLFAKNEAGSVVNLPVTSISGQTITPGLIKDATIDTTVSVADGFIYDCGVYPSTAPAVPTGLSVTPAASQAALSWTAPTIDGGANITDYSIQYSSNAGSTYSTFSHAASTSTSATITGLATGSYLFRVAAINSVGTGSYVTSSSTSVTGSASAPNAPTSLTVTPTTGQAALSWAAPANNGGAAITDYSIQYSSNAGSSYTTFTHTASAATSATITGLATGSYLFRVAAINSVGTGSYVTSSSTSVTGAGEALLSIARDNGTSTFTGSGTTGSPFVRATGVEWDLVDGLSHYSWTASATATVTLSFQHSDDSDSGYDWLITRTRGGSTTTQVTGTGTDASGVTVSVISGDVIRITANGNLSLQYFANVSVSAALPPTPLLSIARNNGTSTFTGSGTAVSPFTRATYSAIRSVDGLSRYSWTASGTATVTLSFGWSEPEGDYVTAFIRKNGTNVHFFDQFGGYTKTFTVSVVSGDVIDFLPGTNDGYAADVSVSAT